MGLQIEVEVLQTAMVVNAFRMFASRSPTAALNSGCMRLASFVQLLHTLSKLMDMMFGQQHVGKIFGRRTHRIDV